MALYLHQISTGLKLAGRHHHLHYFMANSVATDSVGNYLFVGFKLQENFHLVFFLRIAVKKRLQRMPNRYVNDQKITFRFQGVLMTKYLRNQKPEP